MNDVTFHTASVALFYFCYVLLELNLFTVIERMPSNGKELLIQLRKFSYQLRPHTAYDSASSSGFHILLEKTQVLNTVRDFLHTEVNCTWSEHMSYICCSCSTAILMLGKVVSL
jgi:hypothetical protein